MQMSTMDTETGEMIVKRVSVPIGLEELMEGLTKEILLKKPDDIYLFAAEYFARLLLLREKGSYKAKTLRTAQSISKQIPKQPPEKLVVRGASKQLSRQISIRGESPAKRVSPTKKPLPRKDHKEDKSVERNRFSDRQNKPKQTEPAETKNIEAKPKHTISRIISDNTDASNKRDRSVSSNRRGRSVTKSVQSTPRQKSTSTPRAARTTTGNDKLNKPQNKDEYTQQTSKMQNEVKENPPVPKIPSVEEGQGFIKDGKLTVTPPKIIKRPQVAETGELISSLIVPQAIANVAPVNQNIASNKSTKEVKDKTLEAAELQESNKQKTSSEKHETHKEKDDIIEETTNKDQLDRQINSDSKINDIMDKAQNELEAESNNTSSDIEKEISISIDDDKLSSETKSIPSTDGKVTPTNLSNVDDKKFNELKSTETSISIDDDKLSSETKSTPSIDGKVTPTTLSSGDDKKSNELKNTKISTSADDEKLSSETKSIPSIDGKVTPTNLSNVENKKLHELKSSDIVKKHEDSHGVNNTDNTSDDQTSNLLTDDSSASEISDKEIEGTKLPRNESKLLSQIEESSKESSLLNDTDDDINIINDEKNNLTFSVSKDSDKAQNELTLDHQMLKDELVGTPTKTQFEVVEKDIISIGNKTGEEKNSKETSLESGGSSENKELDKEIQKDSSESSFSEILEKGGYQNDGGRDIKHDKEIKKNEDKEEPIQNINGAMKIVFDSKEDITKQDYHNKNESHKNKKENFKQQSKDDKDKIDNNQFSDKGIDANRKQTHLHENVEPVERENIDLSINAKENIRDQTEENSKTESNNIKDESIEKSVLETQGTERNAENDINLMGTENNEKRPIRVKREATAVDDLEGDTITLAIESGGNKLKINNNFEIDANKIENINAETIANETKISAHLGEKQDGGAILPDSKESDLKDQDKISKSEECPRTDLTRKGTEPNKGKIDDADTEQEKSHYVTDTVSTDEKITTSKEDDENVLSLTDSKSEKAAHKENSESNEKLTSPRTNTNLMENAENIPVINKENTNELSIDNFAVNTVTQRDKETNVFAKLNKVDGDKLKDTEEIDSRNEKDTNGMTNKDALMKEHSDKTMKHFDDKIESNNIIETITENEKEKIATVLVDSNNEETNNESDKKDTSSGSENLNNTGNINRESKHLQKTESTTSTNNITLSSDINHKSSDNKEAQKQEKHTKIEKNQGIGYNTNVEHIYESNANESDDKTTDKETPIRKDESNEVLAESQSKNSEKDTDHDKEAKILNKQMGEDLNVMETTHDNTEEAECLKNSDLSARVKFNKNEDKKNGTNALLDLATMDKTTVNNSLEGNLNEPNIQTHDAKSDRIESINSVINVAKKGPVDHVVKKCIGDFIQQEQEHVFVENPNQQLKPKDIMDENNDLKEIEENTSVERNEAITDKGNEMEPVKVETREVDKDLTENNAMKDIINSTVSLTQTEKVDEIQDVGKNDRIESINSVINVAKEGPVDHVVKKYIGDFIQQEQQHVFVENPNQQVKPKDIMDENNELKEIEQNTSVERNEGNEMEPVKVETQEVDKDLTKDNAMKDIINSTVSLTQAENVDEIQDVDKSLTKKNAMKNIINSTLSLAQTGKVDEILKVHIDDFLSNEKKNIFTENKETINTSDSLAESHQKPITVHEIENGIKANRKSAEVDSEEKSESIIRKGSSKNLKQPETQSLSMKQNGKSIKSRSASQANIRVPEDNVRENNKNKVEKKLRRVQTVDVIKDRNKPKMEVKSRIPTADYSKRVKREKENGGHSVLIKQISNSQEVLNKLPGKVIAAVNNIDKITDSNTDNKQGDVIENENENVEHKKHEEVGVHQSSKDLKEADKSELYKSGFDNSKLREELKAVDVESKFATFKPKFNPYVLRQEIKNASSSDGNNEEIIGNKESDNFLTQIAAALKIQSVWRGFKVRKNKAKIPIQQNAETETIIEQKKFQEVQEDKNLNEIDITENGIKTDSSAIVKDHAKIEDNESEQSLNGIVKSWSKEDNREVQSNSEENQGVDVSKLEYHAEEPKVYPQQTANIETISGNKDSQLKLQVDKNLNGKDTIKTDSSNIKNQDTDIETDNNEGKSDLKRIVQSENNQSSRVEPLNSQESENQRDVKYLKLENLDEDSNKINEDKFIEAAVMIQKIWRAFKVRKNMKQKCLDEKSSHKNNELLQGSTVNNKVDIERKLGTLKLESDSLESENSHIATEKFTKAAITIQKVWRGFKIRRNIKETHKNDIKAKESVTELDSSKSKESPKQSRIESTQPKIEVQSANLPFLTDDKFTKAALTIQKIWRGFNARKTLKQNHNQENDKKDHQVKSEDNSFQINEEDSKKESAEEVVNKKMFENLKATPEISSEFTDLKNYDKFVRAATKIQTLWRGFKVRKVLKANNKQIARTDEVKKEHSNGTTEITTGKSEVKLEKQSNGLETGNDEFIKAAIKIQKIWRGFKVRKVLKKGDLFGTKVESEKPVIESMKTTEEIHPKDKKSALKIQSLWRGYQVRKNINIIKDKLEEKIPANDADKGKELTDEDILNAAIKIQAGVRGYLQRKRYKRNGINLNSIAEEDIDEKEDRKKDAVNVNSESLTQKSTKDLEEEARSQKKQLSEDEVFKALEALNKLEIPNDNPLSNETSKPKFYRSHTVQEPEIVKKQNSPLLQTVSLSETTNTQEDREMHKTQSSGHFKDSNNNSSDKFIPLEMETKEVAQDITKTNERHIISSSNDEVNAILANTATHSEALINKDVKQYSNDVTSLVQENRAENIDSSAKGNKKTENIMDETNKIQPVTSEENTLYESINEKPATEKQAADNNDKKTSLSKTESTSNISLLNSQQTEVNKPIDSATNNYDDKISSKNTETKNNHTQDNVNESKNLNPTDVKFDEVSKRTEFEDLHSSTNKTFEITPSESVVRERDTLPNDEQSNERPVSIDSTDSAITVIDNELSGDNGGDTNENEGETKNNQPEELLEADDKTKGNLLEHENLINDFQNKLLNQISGKNGDKTSAEDATKKFDIEQLRKELEEAGLIYNTDDTINIQHQNSSEESNVQDQLFDYLHELKSAELNPEEESNINASPRDLPDIKEEDPDTKSEADSRHEKSNIVLNNHNKASINESIKGNIPDGGINIEKLQSTLRECENIAHEINKDIKITETQQQPIEGKTTLKAVESDLTENKLNTDEHGVNQIKSGKTFCAIPQGKTFEGKYIDNRPLSDHTEQINVNSNSDVGQCVDRKVTDIKSEDDNTPTDLPSIKETTQTNSSSGSGLLHTGELHDSVLVSLPSTSETDSLEPDSLENMNTELSSQNDTLTSTAQHSKLLHTGELHDTVVVPLPEKIKSDLKTEIDKQRTSTGIMHTISNNSEQLDAMPIPLQPKGNIASEESNPSGSNIPTITGLLHTGELHDSVVVPLSIEARHVAGKANEQMEIVPLNSTKIIPSEGELTDLSQQDQSTKESQNEPPAPTYTRLLHTGELHDTVVVPVPAVGQSTIGTEDTETGYNQLENTPRQVDSESQTTGQVHAVPIEVQLNQAPGVALMTSPRPVPAIHGVSSVEDDIAQTPDKGALPIESSSDFSSPSGIQSMESETRKNATINNKSMEVEAATKIQAGFRGYQVRKQLKLKNGSSDINNQRRQLRRKSSGRITDNGRISQNKTKDPNDIEEKSAVKIQAGVRGFLVRRRQKKQKTQES